MKMMDKLSQLWRRLLFYVRRDQFDRELEEEMRFHMEMKAQENAEAGMEPLEARYAAQRQFGNQTLLREVSREMWSFRSLETLFQDLRYGVRMLLKNPGFTLIAVVTLALGIGANTAIFSVTSALVLRPFDFHDLDRLVWVYETAPQQGNFPSWVSPADFADLRRQQKVFAGLAAFRLSNSNLTGVGEPERMWNSEVTAEFFRLLGFEAAFGRAFLPEEEQAGRGQVAVLGHGLWQRRFGADPKIIGATISLDEKAYTVIGVMPEGFDFPKGVELWTPLALGNEAWNERRAQSLQVVARLKPGVELGQVNAEVETLAARLAEQYPQTNAGRGATVRLLRHGNEYQEVFLSLLMGAAGFVLLIACVNIANMQLARASSRSREMAVRAALGARRLRLVRRLLTESLLLSLLGGVCGLLVAFGLLDFIRGGLPLDQVQYIPGWKSIRVNERVMIFTLLVSLASSVVFGLVPALQSSNPNLNEALKEGGRSDGGGAVRQRMRKALIVAEIALALALLVGAGLMVKGFARMIEKQQQGFDPRHALTLRATLPPSRYADERRIAAFHLQAQERLSALPGVESASSTSFLPGSDAWNSAEFQIEGLPAPPPGQERVSSYQQVGADYFRTVRIPVIKGREFSADDVEGAPLVAVISEKLARRYFPNEDPLGRRVKVGAPEPAATWYTIVGVAGDVPRFMFDREMQPTLYLPNQQLPDRNAYFVVRASGAPMAALPAVRAQIAALDDKLPLYEIKSHEQVIADRMAGLRLVAALMMMFGALALTLASVGVYGVMAYAVSQRTREIGVRMALGARPQDVLRLVLGQSLKLAALGLAIGLPVALALGRAMAGALFGVIALDPMTFVSFTLLLTGAALLAGYLPAQRATKVDPITALRSE
jgi:putative ABC transport system permease protein